jgi:peptidoglycan/LPS O-acetylase OafA/YrhL
MQHHLGGTGVTGTADGGVGRSGRLIVLDLLRCLAVLLVLGRHIHACPAETSGSVHDVVEIWRRGGWVGVDLFLVLSGFLVSGLIFREYLATGTVRIGRFLIRRGFKIYPAFWAMIGFSVLLPLGFGGAVDARAMVAELLFVQNYVPGLWDHTWSLGLEEQFYLILALGAWWSWRRARARGAEPFRSVPVLVVVAVVGCLLARLAVAWTTPVYDNRTFLYGIHLRVDAFLVGTGLAYLWHVKELRARPWFQRVAPFLGPLGLLLFVPAFVVPLGRNWIPVAGLLLFSVGGACLILAGLATRGTFSPVARGLARVGEYSYSIYLWHLPVNYWIAPWILKQMGVPVSWFLYANTYLFGSIALGILMAKVLEVPMLRLRDRLFPGQVRAVAAAPAPAA